MRLEMDGDAIYVPRPAYGPGGLIGDGFVVLRPGDPEYEVALDEFNRQQENGPPGIHRPPGM
jgi:hypothetical protein